MRKLAAVASLTTVAVGAGSVVPAFAEDGVPEVLANVGSDTSYWMIDLIQRNYNVVNADGDQVVSVPPVNVAPFPLGEFVPGDTSYGTDVLWDSSAPAVTPPNGSGAGKTYLLTADGANGKVDFSRSSSNKSGSDPATLEAWAYALGALAWVNFPGNKAPATTNLTVNDLTKIYTCDPGTGQRWTTHDNWNDFGGTADQPIVKYFPQTGSGTRSFAIQKFLGNVNPDTNCNATTLANDPTILLQEHDARGVTAATKARAIYVFDWSRWTAQSKGLEADLRNGSVIRTFEGKKPTGSTVNETATRYAATRYIFNFVRTDSVDYEDVLDFTGVPAGVGANPPTDLGYICNNKASKQIIAMGFRALKKQATGGTKPNSYCRLNPPTL